MIVYEGTPTRPQKDCKCCPDEDTKHGRHDVLLKGCMGVEGKSILIYCIVKKPRLFDEWKDSKSYPGGQLVIWPLQTRARCTWLRMYHQACAMQYHSYMVEMNVFRPVYYQQMGRLISIAGTTRIQFQGKEEKIRSWEHSNSLNISNAIASIKP